MANWQTSGACLNHIPVTTATHTVLASDLKVGTNIIGVNYAGAVTVTLPASINISNLITINDESCLAGTNNITINAA